MYKKIINLFSSKTLKQSAITVISTFLSAGLGAVYYLILARLLGPHNYGLLSLGTVVLTILLTVADVGSGQGTVRFVAEHKTSPEYLSFAKLALQVKIYSGLFTSVVLTLFSQPIAVFIVHQPELAPLLPVVGVAILCQLLFTYSMSVFQGLQQFASWGGIQIGANSIRLVFVGILMLLSFVNPVTALWAFCLASLVGFLASWLVLDRRILTTKIKLDHPAQFWNFNRWTAAFMILTSIVSRLDTFLTARYLSLAQTGVYSLSVTMVSFLPQMSSAVGAVTGARFASISDPFSAKIYLKKALLFSTGISLGVALLMIPTSIFVIWFTGKDYTKAFVPFLILLISLALFSATNPFRDALLYYFHQPHFFVWATLFQGLVIFIAGSILTPRFAEIGSALTVLLSQIFLGLISFTYCTRQINKL